MWTMKNKSIIHIANSKWCSIQLGKQRFPNLKNPRSLYRTISKMEMLYDDICRKENYMKKKLLFVGILLFVITFFIVGIPLIINESYKSGYGYITVWDGGSVLEYYGSIFGSAIAVATIVITIIFTRKQIKSERYLSNESYKWSKIESIFANILDAINPIRSLNDIMDNGFSDPSKAIHILQKYQMNCKLVCDQLNAHLNIADYSRLKKLIDEITKASDIFFKTSQVQVDNYTKLRDLQRRNVAEKMFNQEKEYPGCFSKQEISDGKKLIEKTNNYIYTDIEKDVSICNAEIIGKYETIYKELLKRKGSIFGTINLEVQQTADDMLKFKIR